MHPHMALQIEEVIELTTMKEKCTAIIPSGPAPMNCMLWSIFSLLLRSKPHGLMEHFIVCLNGPDKRTGDPGLQDKKQQFLHELRNLKLYHADQPDVKKDMPITVIRAWSRVGHAESVEMAVPWVHTDTYLLLHDDIIITDRNWDKEVFGKFYSNPNAVIGYGSDELLFAHCDHCIAHGLFMIRMPNMYTYFLVVRKSLQRKIGATWLPYYLGSYANPIQFDLIDEVVDLTAFQKFYEDRGLWGNPPQTQEMFNFAHMGMGSWFWYKAAAAGLDMVPLKNDMVEHIAGMSFVHDTSRKDHVENKLDAIQELETEILSHPEYSKLYMKYKTKENV